MSDNPDKRGQVDGSRINTTEEYEVRYWSEKLSVTPEEIVRVVIKVGSMVEDVKRELGK